MVRVEPFVFQMVTAFKERIQMVSKINEIIGFVNQDVSIEEVRALVTEMLGNYYNKEQIDEMFDAIDFSPYYTKTEVNAIVSRIDGDVDVVEGRMTTAEGDIDALETGKQDVLTAGDGIDITNDVVSLDNGWETFTTPTNINQLDTDKYDYLFESGDVYALLVKASDKPVCFGKSAGGGRFTCFGDTSLSFGNAGGAFYPCKLEVSQPKSYTISNVKVYLMDGTLLDANNKATYFTNNKPNVDMRVTGKYGNFILDVFLPANSSSTYGMMYYNGTIRFVNIDSSTLYSKIGVTDTYPMGDYQMAIPKSYNEYHITTCYRRLK